MKLADLNPQFYDAGGEGISDAKTGEPVPLREGVGVGFFCPCGCGCRVFIDFSNPLDGGPPRRTSRHTWKRTGKTFEDLTLTPSIQRFRSCDWHGFLTDGVFRSV